MQRALLTVVLILPYLSLPSDLAPMLLQPSEHVLAHLPTTLLNLSSDCEEMTSIDVQLQQTRVLVSPAVCHPLCILSSRLRSTW